MSLRPLERLTAQPVPISRPRLLLRPAAFLKLTYLCQAADTEVGGFGLSSQADPLTIDDILIVRQEATIATVEFDDQAVADLVDTMADQNVPPQRCCRVWVHTHPGNSASPSGTDERTFARSFGGADFSIMLILARGGALYARLQLIGPVKTAVEIPVIVDWAGLPDWLDETGPKLPELIQLWATELQQLVTTPLPQAFIEMGGHTTLRAADDEFGASRYPDDWLDQAGMDDELLAEMEEDANVRDYLY